MRLIPDRAPRNHRQYKYQEICNTKDLIVPNDQANDRLFRRLTKGDNIALGTGIAIAHSIMVDGDDNIIVNWILFTLTIITPIHPILS